MTPPAPPPLRLHAHDAEDLAVFSACLQDAILAVKDMRYFARRRRFVLALHRFCWERLAQEGSQWVACGLHFDGVLRAQSAGFGPTETERRLELLAINFQDDQDRPSGWVELLFAGGGMLRLTVECLDAHLMDIGSAEPLDLVPRHPLPPTA